MVPATSVAGTCFEKTGDKVSGNGESGSFERDSLFAETLFLEISKEKW